MRTKCPLPRAQPRAKAIRGAPAAQVSLQARPSAADRTALTTVLAQSQMTRRTMKSLHPRALPRARARSALSAMQVCYVSQCGPLQLLCQV